MPDTADAASSVLTGAFDVVVVGGGITGAATTFYLATAGVNVVLVEQHELNTESSGRNAGSLHGQIQHAPFVERGEGWARYFLPALAFLADSVGLWGTLGEELGTDLEVTTGGGLLIADDESQMKAIERKVRLEQAAGFSAEVIGREDLLRIAPYVSDRMIGAELANSEGVGNPLLAVPALATAARKAGAQIFTNTAVTAIEPSSDHQRVMTSRGAITARRVVIASGSGLAGHARRLGVELPITDEAIQLSVTEPLERFVSHLVYYAGAALTFKQAKAGSLLIGGGWPADTTGPQPRVSADSLRRNVGVALKVVPSIGHSQLVRSWVGVVRETPDLLPIIGTVPGRPSIVLGLFPHMGFTAGPMMGRTLADIVLENAPRHDLAPFSPDRF